MSVFYRERGRACQGWWCRESIYDGEQIPRKHLDNGPEFNCANKRQYDCMLSMTCWRLTAYGIPCRHLACDWPRAACQHQQSLQKKKLIAAGSSVNLGGMTLISSFQFANKQAICQTISLASEEKGFHYYLFFLFRGRATFLSSSFSFTFSKV